MFYFVKSSSLSYCALFRLYCSSLALLFPTLRRSIYFGISETSSLVFCLKFATVLGLVLYILPLKYHQNKNNCTWINQVKVNFLEITRYGNMPLTTFFSALNLWFKHPHLCKLYVGFLDHIQRLSFPTILK